MKRLILLVLMLAALWSQTVSAGPSEDAAVTAGQAWLKLVDDRDYAGSWAGAGTLFQSGVSEDRWVEMVKSVRDRLGSLKSRTFDAVTLTKTLPGVPDGDYAMVRFKAAYEKKQESLETITLVLEGGVWKAGGYFIQ